MSGLDPKRIREVIDRCLDYDRLSKWERNFLESISDWYDNKGFLTPGQEEHLEKIDMKVP